MSARPFIHLLCLAVLPLLPLSEALALSQSPSDAELFEEKAFPEPLVPFGQEVAEPSNRALAEMLARFDARQRSDDYSELEAYVAANPGSRWNLAVLTNLGLLQYRAGYFSRSIETFRAAWLAGQDAKEARARTLADRAAGEYTKMLARLGRYPELKAFLAEVKGRQFVGQATELMMAGKEGSTTMELRPEISFRCGPMALSRILANQKSSLWASPVIFDSRSTMKGMSLAEVAAISGKLGLNYQPAKRSPGASIILPSVIHWKAGHYAALIEKVGDRYHTEDPTFENDTWHSLEALESEASGYFLVPPGPLPSGWTSVGNDEAAAVFGKGNTSGPDPDPSPDDPTTNPPPPAGNPPCGGMASYTFRAMLTSLQIMDSPVGYRPPYGDAVFFTATYLQRDSNQPSNFTYSNLGPKWNFGWQQYVTDDPTNYFAALAQYKAANKVKFIQPTVSYGGGSGGVYGPAQLDTHAKLKKPKSGLPYTIANPDGSQDVYGQPDGSKAAGRKVFLTQHIDPAGNITTLSYDKTLRLTTVTDALGQKTTLSYELTNDRYKVTKVADPFGRFATFSYDDQGRLTKIRDVIGIESSFTYEGAGDFINTLTTPYGTTTFTTEGEGTYRRLTATDPAGSTEVLESNSNGTIAVVDEAVVPTGFENTYLTYRNSFHWNKKQWREHPKDYANCHIYHWLHSSDGTKTSPILESEKFPLQSRIWYQYPGQPNGYFVGTSSTPIAVGRVVEVAGQNESQITRSTLNDLGLATSITDPLGRIASYTYAPNQIDLLTASKFITGQVEARFINAGGGAVGVFSADSGFSSSSSYSSGNPVTTDGVANAAPGEVYQSGRYGPQFNWTGTGLPTGKIHTVRLHFAELYVNQPGKRVFDVSINGAKVISNLDLFVAAGSQANKAVVKEFKAAPDSSGNLTISFKSSVENAVISGIEVFATSSPGVPVLGAYTWNAKHRPLTYTDAAGQKTVYTWNGVGQLTSVTNAKKETTTFGYYTADATGRQRKGRLATLNGALAGGTDLVTFDYDAAGNVASVKGPDGYILALNYDALDRLTKVSFPDGTTTETTYLALDPQTSRDRLGRTTSYVYNSIRQLESVTDPLNRTIGYRWCKCGALSQLIDALGRVTAWKHDSAGRVTAKVYADGSTVNYAYEPLSGRLSSITDEKGQVKSRSYNLDDTLAGLTYTNAEHPTPNVAFTYDTDFRRLKTMLDGIGTTNYAYNPIAAGTLGAGRLASVDGPLPDDTLTYTYDELGRNTGYAINGVGETRTYDPLGRLLKAVNPLGTFGYTYVGATSRMDRVTYPNGMTCQYNYHPLKPAAAGGSGDFRLKDIIHTLPGNTQLSRHSYEYNAVGDITRWTQISPQAGLRRSWLCGYDAADQLTSVASQDPDTLAALPTGQYGYSYDLAGNRLTETIDGVTATSSVNALNQLTSLTTAGASTLPQQTYEWDAEDRLSAINYTGTNERTEFEYNGYGRQLGVRGKQGATVTSYRRFAWLGLQLREERDASGVIVQKRYFPRGMQTTGAGGTFDQRLFTRDHLGSVRQLVSSASGLTSIYDFDPWGRRSMQLGQSDESSLAFTGHWFHDRSGLTIARFRGFNPPLGRWINRDRIEERDDVNMYRYVKNCPTVRVDHFGLAGEPMYLPPEEIDPYGDESDNLMGLTGRLKESNESFEGMMDEMEKEAAMREANEGRPICPPGETCWMAPPNKPSPPKPYNPCDYFPNLPQCTSCPVGK